ncbi:TPR and ankyrin repeat-containing protein 1 [Glycine soja]|uniref:TPR and ankyrin repeat-containing protein 1 n=1 Tax=Glycine soja TaxID=3848 RepID=A0A0B2R404_GLYSO|nr:TPR and ankyrin repeat-containing protein 1 [Glycine soja]
MVSRVESGTLIYYQLYELNAVLRFNSSPITIGLRYFLLILGNERTLTNEENVWKSLVLDAKKRQCFFSADEDKELAKSIWDTKKELDKLDDLLNADNFFFKNSRWKVLFSDSFLKSFKKLRSKQTKKLVLDLLLKLSTGWKPKRMKEKNIMPPEDVPKLVKRLDNIFGSYTDEFISRCSEKCLEGIICGGNISAERNSIEEDIVDVDTSIQFKNTPDSFMNLPIDSYPLVITFQKFLMMLDGTVGISYLERFSDLSSDAKNLSARSVALETFIRKKEVTYDRFDSLYWLHFNSQYTKKLDSSRVFTEIISHIKGGMQGVESSDGKLSREEYLSLSENQGSSLTRPKREIIHDVYQSYEKMKNDKGDFDLADIVIYLHRRLKMNKYEGDKMHFLYIDEVQDLTMTQIALFKYVCQNVEEGFVFCGATAQTIARGLDFRFQDIKSLFYMKFVLESKGNTYNQGKVKGKISETFLLSRNFHTHAGVLKLSQSTIELLFDYVGKKALVLTILDCKGLEFQDVLLYNFFDSSPLKNRGRVIYEYMKEQDMLEPTEHKSYPNFRDSKHNLLSSELKQLYVAITLTRQIVDM